MSLLNRKMYFYKVNKSPNLIPPSKMYHIKKILMDVQSQSAIYVQWAIAKW